MDKFIAVAFADEAKAYTALKELLALHDEGSLTVYGTAVVQRTHDGVLSVKQRADQGPLGAGTGSLIGAMVGLLGGPAGAAIGFSGGALVGSLRDYVHAGVSEDFVADLEKELAPGSFALVAEVFEEWVAPLNTRMEALGGKVLREPRKEFVDAQIQSRVDQRRGELERRKQERATAKAERMESRLNAEIYSVQDDLRRTGEKAEKQIDRAKQEMAAKLKALQEQAARSRPDAQRQIEARIAEVRKQFGEREKLLKQALELAQQAIR